MVQIKATVPHVVLDRLDKSELSSAEKRCLLELFSLVVGTIGDSNCVQDRSKLYDRLVEAMLDDTNLLAPIRQQAAELDALKRISYNLTSSLDLSVIFEGVVEEALKLVRHAQNAHIFMYQDGRLTFGAALDTSGKREMFSEPRPGGLTSTVAREKRMIIVEDMTEHPLFAEKKGRWEGSIVGIPLMMGTRVVGVMNLVRNNKGTFPPADIRLLTLLADQAAIAIVNARLHEAVSRLARIDGLTGLPNRRALDERLEQEIAHANRSGSSFAVVMMDLDGFKKINDTHGHEVGDDVLRQVAAGLQSTVRSTDFLARYGGDELTLILMGTNLQQAQFVAGKIKKFMSQLAIKLPGAAKTTMGLSGGIALYPKDGESATRLLRAADEALYRAKNAGRDRFLVAGQRGKKSTTK
ncbi:MAG: GGDEF domain-containing protein [Anaerolineales bacterium]|nr:GGDEF domain-containing protein [Anaerolineales bacterium]